MMPRLMLRWHIATIVLSLLISLNPTNMTAQAIFHSASSRGHADHGWLNTYHSFSFASWHNPERMHFGALRVLNDDQVAAGRGFGRHPHDNMEIISIPLSGDLRHADSMGNETVIREGDVQIMSAGTGVVHSEFNHSEEEEVRFLQIWIYPEMRDLAPSYDQKHFPPSEQLNTWQNIVRPASSSGEGVAIHQNAWLHLGRYGSGATPTYRAQRPGNGVYVFVLEGKANIEGQELERRDAIGIDSNREFRVECTEDSRILLLDVPMQW